MNLKESIKVGITGISTHKLRSSLTVLGIVFGVSAVIAMLSIGEGAKQESLEQIAMMGMNNIIIRNRPQPDNQNQKNSDSKISMKDAAAIKEICPFVESLAPQIERKLFVQYKDNRCETKLIGTNENYLSIFNYKLLKGRFINAYSLTNAANVCVIGYRIKETLFHFEDPIGKKIKIQDIWFDVIGVLEPKYSSAKQIEGLETSDRNYDIIVPITSVINRVSKKVSASNNQGSRRWDPFKYIDKNSVDQITVKIKNADDITNANYLVKKILTRRHNNIPDFQITIPEELLRQSQKTQRIFNIVMGAIAGISLLVGGIGIMNIMLASVLERTKEIGVRRAIGASRYDILMQFLIEAIALSIIGGLIGVLLGYGMTKLISGYAGWRTIVNSWSIILSFGVSLITGLVFGIYPAKNAAEKEPIDALRYE